METKDAAKDDRAVEPAMVIQKSTLELLKAGRELLSDPARVCRGALAQTANGGYADPRSSMAHSFCTVGALRKLAPSNQADDTAEARALLCMAVGHNNLTHFHDTSEHEAILRAWDKAIAIAEVHQATTKEAP